MAFHPGCASRELALSLFDRFLTFAVLNIEKPIRPFFDFRRAERQETSEMVYPNAHSSEPKLESFHIDLKQRDQIKFIKAPYASMEYHAYIERVTSGQRSGIVRYQIPTGNLLE